MAISLRRRPAVRSASMSSAMARASSSSSHTPLTTTAVTQIVIGEQGLAQPRLVVGDEMGGRRQNMALGAIVALQPNDLGAGKVRLETQDVVHLGPAPTINRLIVIADAANVRCLTLRQQPQPEILGDVGVLVFI